jgi:hypothetical protein
MSSGESEAVAEALAARSGVILFFRAQNCRLCKALSASGDLEALAQGLPVKTITTDDQAQWAPEVCT